MIRSIQVLAIPALGKEEFQAKSIRAVGVNVGLRWQEVTVQGRLRCGHIVQTVESESLLSKRILVCIGAGPRHRRIRNRQREASQIGVSGDDFKTVGSSNRGGQFSTDIKHRMLVVPEIDQSRSWREVPTPPIARMDNTYTM